MAQVEQQGSPMNALSLEVQYRIFADAFELEQDAEARDLLKLDYLYHQRSFRLPDFMRNAPWSSSNGKTRTWRGDGKSPIVEFHHQLSPKGTGFTLHPSDSPLHYAIAHPERDTGYFKRPVIHPVTEIPQQ
jgi:hypothetical protein